MYNAVYGEVSPISLTLRYDQLIFPGFHGASTNRREVNTMYEDKTLVCKECGNEFVFTAGGQTLAQIPLVAEEAVPRLTFGQIFLKLLRRVTMAAES